MPIYEYGCQKCGSKTEALQKFTDAPLAECKVCGGELERLLSAPAIQFKGSGWYVNDYAGKNGHSNGSSSKESETKTESKPEAKTGSSAAASSTPSPDNK